MHTHVSESSRIPPSSSSPSSGKQAREGKKVSSTYGFRRGEIGGGVGQVENGKEWEEKRRQRRITSRTPTYVSRRLLLLRVMIC